MVYPFRRALLPFVLLLSLFALRSTAAEPAMIAKARAVLGTDAVLDALKSVHYVGTLTGRDATDPTKLVSQSIEIIIQKPAQQRIRIVSPTQIDVTALDEYEAWRRVTDAKDPSKWQQSQLGADMVKQLRADVWQNLAFFRGIEKIGGRVEDQGPATIDNIPCEKIAFYHSPVQAYFRYFNRATGQLVYTGTPDNNTREEGSTTVGGIRFPKRIIISQLVNGKPVQSTITFDKITVNEVFPARLFAVPLPWGK